MVRTERCLTGRLASAYPAAKHDVEIRVDDVVPTAQLAHLLREHADRVFRDDPACRKVVFGAPVDELEIATAAEAAGFRYVVDVDVPDGSGGTMALSLLVREPDFVTHVDMDLDRVPER